MSDPTYFFWMPKLFEVKQIDTELLTERQFRLYDDLLDLYWRQQCDLPVELIHVALKTTKNSVNNLIVRVPSFVVTNGHLHHSRYKDEYLRAVRISRGASHAAKIRWGGKK